MVIDTNTAMIDQTPGKTLKAKYRELRVFIERNPEALKVVVDEPACGIRLVQIL